MQAARFVVFLIMAEAIARVPLSFIEKMALPVYGVLLVALVLVELIGGVAGGSQRWINLGFMQLQPSEFMKLACVLAVARFEILVVAEGMDVHFFGQAVAQLSAIAAKAGIEDGDSHPPAAKPGFCRIVRSA